MSPLSLEEIALFQQENELTITNINYHWNDFVGTYRMPPVILYDALPEIQLAFSRQHQAFLRTAIDLQLESLNTPEDISGGDVRPAREALMAGLAAQPTLLD